MATCVIDVQRLDISLSSAGQRTQRYAQDCIAGSGRLHLAATILERVDMEPVRPTQLKQQSFTV